MGMNIAEVGHIVNILPAKDITGGAFSDVFSMKMYRHATIIVSVGVSTAAFTKIIVNACDNFTPSTRVALPYKCYMEETAAGDTLTTYENVLAAGKTPSANDNIMYVIEIDSAELPAGYPNLELSLTNGTNACLASAIAILTGARYSKDLSPTVIA